MGKQRTPSPSNDSSAGGRGLAPPAAERPALMAQTVGGYTSSGVLPHLERRLASPRAASCLASEVRFLTGAQNQRSSRLYQLGERNQVVEVQNA
jgi:hypothetical protein